MAGSDSKDRGAGGREVCAFLMEGFGGKSWLRFFFSHFQQRMLLEEDCEKGKRIFYCG